jgi:hypothetical protein
MGNRAAVEIQTTGGTWQKFCDGSKHPSDIKRMLDAALKSQSWITKARTIDADTKQLINTAFKT